MEVRDEALGVTPGRTASSADLGGSSKYRVELFGNAALNGRYISSKAKYWPETDSAQVE